MRTMMFFFATIFCFGLQPDVASAGANKPFVATTVQTIPNGQEQRGKIFVSPDRKSTRLNSSHITNSYAGFCLKKKTTRYTSRTQKENRD